MLQHFSSTVMAFPISLVLLKYFVNDKKVLECKNVHSRSFFGANPLLECIEFLAIAHLKEK